MAANSTPSQTPFWNANNIGQVNKYGAPPNNGNRQPLGQFNSIQTQDYTGRGNTTTGENATNTIDANATNDQPSPLAISATAVALIIPPKATTVTLVSTATFSFSETGTAGVALTQYVAWPANTPITIETARIRQLFVQPTAALSFFFSIL